MKIFKHNENKETGKLPMGRKSRKAFAVYVAAVLCMTCFTTTAFAASTAACPIFSRSSGVRARDGDSSIIF